MFKKRCRCQSENFQKDNDGESIQQFRRSSQKSDTEKRNRKRRTVMSAKTIKDINYGEYSVTKDVLNSAK